MLWMHIGLDPVIVRLGPVAVRWYGLAVALAVLVGAWVTRSEVRRRRIDPAHFDALLAGAVAGGIVGARLLHVIDHAGQYLADPWRILAVQQGGLAVYGATLGGLAALAGLSRLYGRPLAPLLDAVAPGLILGQAIGRLGCVVNGDCWGAPTSSPFAFIYTNPHAMLPPELLGVPTHPYPVYDMALNLAVFAVVWRLRRRDLPAGTVFAVFAALYAAGRFGISYVRQETVWFWGLQEAQVIALLALVASLAALAALARRSAATATEPRLGR